MRIGRIGGALGLAAAVGGCGIVAPLYDQRMTDAPRSACIDVDAAPVADAPACFALFEEDGAGRQSRWTGGALEPGRTLIAAHQPGAPRCGGRFSHLVVTGATEGAGRAYVAAWDSMGRAGRDRTLRWDRAAPVETLVLPNIDMVAMLPAGARVRVTEGSFDPASICFKSY